jgi:hypothetical protein
MLRRALSTVVGLPAVGRALLSSAAVGGEASARARHAAAPALTAVRQQSRAFSAFDRGFAHGGSASSGASRAIGAPRSGGVVAGGGVGAVSPPPPLGHARTYVTSLASYSVLPGSIPGMGTTPAPGAPPLSGVAKWGAGKPFSEGRQGDGRVGKHAQKRGPRTPEKQFRMQEKAIVHVSSLLNNTFVTLTTLEGDVLAWWGALYKRTQ